MPFQIIQRSDKQLHAERRATYVNSYDATAIAIQRSTVYKILAV
ncbi:MAG: hypothetical protein V7L11_28235 [Nostoc sp.]